MNVEALALIATIRKRRYLDQYPIAVRDDWEMLKLAEEIGEVSEACDLMLDRPHEETLRTGLAEEMADVAGFLAIVADATGVSLRRDASVAPASADMAWRRFARDAGSIFKAYNRLTGQSRPTGKAPWMLRDEMSLSLSAALTSLDALAGAHDISLADVFDAKWGLPDLGLKVGGSNLAAERGFSL